LATGRGAGRRAGESPALSPRRVPRDDQSTSRTDGHETATIAGSSTSQGNGRLFTPFPTFSQLLPVLQIHFRFHASICTHFISLLGGHFKTFWTVPGTFPSTSVSRILLPVQHPRPEMECQQVCFTNAGDYITPVLLESVFTRFCIYRVQNGR